MFNPRRVEVLFHPVDCLQLTGSGEEDYGCNTPWADLRHFESLSSSNHIIHATPAPKLSAISPARSGAKWKRPWAAGTKSTSARKVAAPPTTHQSAELGTRIILTMLRVHERLARIMTSTDTTRVRKVNARAASGCWLERENRNTPRHAASTLTPSSTAHPTVANENSRSLALRGGRSITLASASSASKMREQEGSMISSKKTICTGNSSNGQSEKKTGSMDRPAIG